jgi:hypothetical protein
MTYSQEEKKEYYSDKLVKRRSACLNTFRLSIQRLNRRTDPLHPNQIEIKLYVSTTRASPSKTY